MSVNLTVSAAPHIRSNGSTRNVMLDVLIALVPAIIAGVILFGLRALTLVLVSAAACVVFEALFCLVTRHSLTVGDLSAVVTGVLLTCVMPSNAPWWVGLIGSFFAIVVVKQLYGGIGKNFLNPALAARAFLAAAYAVYMTSWAVPSSMRGAMVDVVTMATPLSYMRNGEMLPEHFNFLNMFLGGMPGCIGEVSTLAILVGAAYLLIRKVITWRIPVSFLGTVAVLTFVFGCEGYNRFDWMLYNLLSGGLVLGAFFMATDYTASPVNLKAQLLYGFGCGVITVLIRYFGSYPEGTTYAVLIMNCCAWAIDRAMRPRQFGVSAEDIKAGKAAAKAAKKQAKEAAE